MRGHLAATALALAAAFAAPLTAQTVVGHVTEVGLGASVAGALVVLLDDEGGRLAGGLTSVEGRVVLQAPAPGRYHLQVERIGFRLLATEIDVPAAGESLRLDLALEPLALALEGFEVAGERRCQTRGDAGLVADLWSEAAKALRNQEWAEQERLVWFRVQRYERELDARGRLVLGESRRPAAWVTGTPIASRPADELLGGGFVREADGGGYEYFGPDAAVLLSDTFLNEYCFGLAEADEGGAVGLTFRPLRSGDRVGVTGTLWLEPETAMPNALDFGYTRSPWNDGDRVASGRVEFEELPQGILIVRRWWIRMPTMIDVEALTERGQPGHRLVGLSEAGGEVVEVSSVDRTASNDLETGAVRGVVWDSLQGGPLRDAEVRLGEGAHAARTDADGRFFMPTVPVGAYEATVHHARLDELGVRPTSVLAVVRPRQATAIKLGMPSMSSLLHAFCSWGDLENGASVLVGRVRDRSGGIPVPGASVAVEWTTYRTQGGREIRGDVRTMEVVTDERGRYRVCGIPPGVLSAARATWSAATGPTRQREIGRARVEVLDLTIEASAEPVAAAVPGRICTGQGGGPARASVVGRVRDAATEVPVGGTRVWLVPEDSGEARSTIADAEGRFAFCDLDPRRYVVRTSVRGLGEARDTVAARQGDEATAELALVLGDDARSTGSLTGRVVTADGRRPVAGAEIRLVDGRRQTSGAEGEFRFDDVPVGAVDLSVSHLGFAEASGSLVLGGGQSVSIEILLSPQPIELDPIVVEAVRFSSGGMLADVRRRAASAWGTVVLGDELQTRQRSATRTTDILQIYGGQVHVNGTQLRFGRSGCSPHVYLDGVQITRLPRSGSGGAGESRAEEAASAVNMVHPSSLAAIEIYRGPAETPAEFLDSDARCGVVLLWTKRGGL